VDCLPLKRAAATGLGLTQVFGFIKQSGGDAKIHSEVGVRTTVALYLPRVTGAAPVGQALEPITARGPGRSMSTDGHVDYAADVLIHSEMV
jgi:hypothetical protein